MTELLYIASAILATGFLKLGFAIGAGVFLTPVMTAVIHPPSLGIASMASVLWLTDTEGLRRYWGKWDTGFLLAVLPTAVFGTMAGAYLTSILSADDTRKLVGVLAVCFLVFQLFQDRWKLSVSRLSPGILAGFGVVIGLVGAVANSGGIIVSLLLLYLRLEKAEFLATMSAVLSLLGAIKLGLFVYLEVLPLKQFFFILLFLPLILVGGHLGVAAQKKVSQKAFRLIVSAGVMMLSINMLFA